MENCYYQLVENGPVAKFFEKHYLKWQLEFGRGSVEEFAKRLNISQGYLSQLLNGTRKGVGYKTALRISEKLNDYTLLDILGYKRPDTESIPLSSLPPELRERLRVALLEIEQTFKTRSIQPDSPEGLEISVSVLKKHGFTISDITNPG